MTTNTYKPILFSTEMVQAILAERKTQTRRILKVKGCKAFVPESHWDKKELNRWGAAPKYQPGDILWVRETFCLFGYDFIHKANLLAADLDVKWKPSLFMPKKAARIFLKVTNVRCERLQDISEEDAIAEGIERYGPFGEFKGDPHPAGGMMIFRAYTKAARAFQDLWDSINGKKHPWESNPWVWVYDFERIEKPEDFLL